ncbi:MAG: hypothetical protein L3J04_00840 [Robiginitomaculum sp.]|nr:hypothetical protein [Robiginitomaculum sp.]
MTFTELPPALHVALFFATFYFLAALLTGVWKWRSMLSSKEGQAHKYIDIAHHAALHYGLDNGVVIKPLYYTRT